MFESKCNLLCCSHLFMKPKSKLNCLKLPLLLEMCSVKLSFILKTKTKYFENKTKHSTYTKQFSLYFRMLTVPQACTGVTPAESNTSTRNLCQPMSERSTKTNPVISVPSASKLLPMVMTLLGTRKSVPGKTSMTAQSALNAAFQPRVFDGTSCVTRKLLGLISLTPRRYLIHHL